MIERRNVARGSECYVCGAKPPAQCDEEIHRASDRLPPPPSVAVPDAAFAAKGSRHDVGGERLPVSHATWCQVKRCDPLVRELADRHYTPRRKKGARDFMANGRTYVLRAEAEWCGEVRRAGWGAIENLDGAGRRRFRCALFRNEGPWLSSELIRFATWLTQERWHRRFGWDPYAMPLTTEVDPERTRRKRDPGRCFRRAGWFVVGESRGLVVLQAPNLIGAMS